MYVCACVCVRVYMCVGGWACVCEWAYVLLICTSLSSLTIPPHLPELPYTVSLFIPHDNANCNNRAVRKQGRREKEGGKIGKEGAKSGGKGGLKGDKNEKGRITHYTHTSNKSNTTQ